METTQTEHGSDIAVDELSMLKQRARIMGISFSNNISVETLKQKIAEKQLPTEPENKGTAATNPLVSTVSKKSKTPSLRKYLQDEQMKLVRLRITNLDPKKKDLPGEIITVANEYLGTVRKFVPFGEQTDDGYHVPYCIYNELKQRKFLNIRTVKSNKNGDVRVETSWVREFALEVLPQLTREELNRLATAQIAAGSVSE